MRYKGLFDVIWLRSQSAEAEQTLQGLGFVRHAFPAARVVHRSREQAADTTLVFYAGGIRVRLGMSRRFTDDDSLAFARLSGDYNPIHLDPVLAVG